MSLRDRPDFQAWLARFEQRHAAVRGGDERSPTPGDPCEGCGDPLSEPVSGTGYCLVCLAETFGRERGQASGRVAGMIEATLKAAGEVDPDDVRDALEDVLDRFERETGEGNR